MLSRIGIRSAYSLLWGSGRIEDILSFLKKEGVTTVGITDRHNLYALHSIREITQEYGMNYIVGSEVVIEKESLFLFASSLQGFSRLTTLLSFIHSSSDVDILGELQKDSTGLIVITLSSLLLEQLSPYVSRLYGAISPRCFSAVSTSRSLKLPLVAIDDSTMLHKDEYELHHALRAIDLNTTVGRLSKDDCTSPESYLYDTKRYLYALSAWDEALKNTELICTECSSLPLFKELVFPSYDVTTLTVEQELHKRVYQGAEKRYGELSDAIVRRIEYELNIIKEKGFSSYFLIMDDIISMASRTCGRGSAASSIVSYALFITHVDPIKHNLYFERFLNPNRTDPPDIDVDFAWDERDDVLHAVFERFGYSHCARVANHNFFRSRSALKECARCYALSENQLIEMKEDPFTQKVLSIAQRLVGLPRSVSMHCGGVVITPKEVSSYAPIQLSRDAYPLLQWEKEGVESSSLVKIDLLGNRSLAVVRDTLHNIRLKGIEFDEESWNPIEDRKTQQALAQGDTMGVFYIESPAMRQLQKKTQKGDFHHIVIHSSIIRPAANSFINEYIRRLKGGSYKALHPRLEYILQETYGILCYQEDVSKVAVALASFSEAQGDALRKVVTKKSRHSTLQHYKEQFFQGCKKNGISEDVIQEIWAMMLSFEGYSFCKAHSASYAMLSFQSAYLRVHYPAYFMAAVLSNQGGYYNASAYISEARRMGLSIVGPDINISGIKYYGDKKMVVVGFMAIKNLSYDAMKAIVLERKQGGRFYSLEEVAQRLSLSHSDFTSLVASGVCDSLDPTLPRTSQLRTLLVTKHTHSEASLFPIPVESSASTSLVQKKEDPLMRVREFESLGFLRSAHPLMLYTPLLQKIRRVSARSLHLYVGKTVTLIGWPITRKFTLTKTGEAMEFISFEDETALYETVLFPEPRKKFGSLVYQQRPLLLKGKVTSEYSALSLELIYLSTI